MSDHPKRQAPAFQFYADDFIAGTVDMSPSDVGAYIRLLCYQWSRGSAPALPEKMQRVAGCIVSDDVIAKFPLCADGNRRNPRLEKVREASDAFRKKQAEKAGKRWGHNAAALPRQSSGNADGHAEPMPEAMPEACSPSPSPSPISITLDKPAKPKKERKPVERNPVLDALVETCGGDPLATTRLGWAQAATALRDIKEVFPEVTVDDIKAKAFAYRRSHPEWDLTPMALAKHWGSLVERKQGAMMEEFDWRQSL